MKILITEANLSQHCTTYITEPVTEGAPQKTEWRCRDCGETIIESDLPHEHDCSAVRPTKDPA